MTGRYGSAPLRWPSMNVHTSLDRAAHARVRAHLLSLRVSLTQARDALMHYKADRSDRDRLEPAARRVDDLMNLYAGNMRDPAQGSLWIAEIERGVAEVTNPRVAAVLDGARADIAALLELLQPAESNPADGGGARPVA